MGTLHTFHTLELEPFGGFDLRVLFHPDYSSAEDMFAEDDTIAARIFNGELVWFIAQVQASKNGIILGTDFLSGCCYESYDDFVSSSGYIEDMKTTAIIAAKNALKLLSE